ncbi:FecR family protein [Agrobacterium sp. ICMP 6402]|uniref:FecR family protein n=1 Tax=Agrobacterium sp. ICMP 6402 TaxID=2292443 RepID=UPI00129652C7
MTGSAKNASTLREEAVDWFLRRRESPDDLMLAAHFDAWIAGDERHAKAYERVRCLMGDAGALLAADQAFLAKATRRRGGGKAKAAAAAIAGVSLLSAFYLTDMPMRLRSDHMSGTAERQVVTTPDGSTITLNAHSAIALRFSKEARRVVLLRGEIFVEVAPDAARPFSVEAAGGTTTALGTAFDVDMRHDATSVTVLEHSVQVETGKQGQNGQVHENQRVDYSSDGQLGNIETVDPSSVAAWRNGRFIFEDRPLAEVVETFERYLPGRIVVTREGLRQKRLSGNFDLSNPGAALADLAAALEIGVIKAGPYLTVLY